MIKVCGLQWKENNLELKVIFKITVYKLYQTFHFFFAMQKCFRNECPQLYHIHENVNKTKNRSLIIIKFSIYKVS